MSLPVTLTIAGSDSGGGAGIQADLKTFHARGCFGTTAITAVTCQNTTGVSGVQAMTPDIVAGQIRAVFDDFPVAAVKTGMLFSAEIIAAVGDCLSDLNAAPPLVVDPVMVASSGDRLLEKSAEQAMIDFLSRAALITPNLPEAGVILERTIGTPAEMETAVFRLHERTGAQVLLKGGHRLQGDDAKEVTDLFFDGRELRRFKSLRRDDKNTHGTGCTLSAAIAAGLAHGMEMEDAIRAAKDYLDGALVNAPGLGAGTGPLNHMWE